MDCHLCGTQGRYHHNFGTTQARCNHHITQARWMRTTWTSTSLATSPVPASSAARCRNCFDYSFYIKFVKCMSWSAVWQGAEILKYFLQKFLFVKCNLDQQCGYKVCKCPGQKCGKVPKCQNCFFFNKSNLGNATKVLKFKKQGQQGVETIWTKLVMQMMIDTFDTFPAALIQKYLNLAFDFVDFCLSTLHIFICWHLCSQVFSSKNKQTSHYSK